jgi:hypothetical protein
MSLLLSAGDEKYAQNFSLQHRGELTFGRCEYRWEDNIIKGINRTMRNLKVRLRFS